MAIQHLPTERRIPLTGASNFRDLGGYATADGRTVRWRHVFRADALHDLTTEDIEVLRSLALGAVFDLRTGRELEVFGTNPLVDHGVLHHHVPFIPEVVIPGAGTPEQAQRQRPAPDDHAAHAQGYLTMLEAAGPAIARVLTHYAEAGAPAAVFHCTGGRDRTGMTAALILSVLGVPREVIAQDYALTTEYLRFPMERLEKMRSLYGDIITPNAVPVTYAEVMALTLDGLDERYGSPEAYLEQAGVTAEHQDALRRELLDA